MTQRNRIYVAGPIGARQGRGPAASAAKPFGPSAHAVRPKGNQWCPYEESFLIDPTVFEEEGPEWEPTGLLDSSGQPIMAYLGRRDPIGFLWHDENGELRPRDEVIARFDGDGGDLD